MDGCAKRRYLLLFEELPRRQELRDRLGRLLDYERQSAPFERWLHLFLPQCRFAKSVRDLPNR